jgi:hypothetical protein
LFSKDQLFSATGQFRVSFDYLGVPGLGGAANNLGGFFGIAHGFPGSYPAPIPLQDDGQWHHYDLTFNSPVDTTVRLMLEDYVGSGGVAGDVYFDNFVTGDPVVVEQTLAVSAPGTGILAVLAIAGLIAQRRRVCRLGRVPTS